MLKHRTMDSNKVYNLSDRRSFSLSFFKNSAYIHLRDKVKGKSVSLTQEEFKQLVKSAAKIHDKMNKLRAAEKHTTTSTSSNNDSVMDSDSDDE